MELQPGRRWGYAHCQRFQRKYNRSVTHLSIRLFTDYKTIVRNLPRKLKSLDFHTRGLRGVEIQQMDELFGGLVLGIFLISIGGRKVNLLAFTIYPVNGCEERKFNFNLRRFRLRFIFGSCKFLVETPAA